MAYSKLPGEVRKAVNEEYKVMDPDYISFPHKGKMAKGFIFPWEEFEYLVIDDSDSFSYDVSSSYGDDDEDEDNDMSDSKMDLGGDDDDFDTDDDEDEEEEYDEEMADEMDED